MKIDMSKVFTTEQFLAAIDDYTRDNGVEAAYQVTTQLLKMGIITLDQWHITVEHLYA